MNEKDTRSLLFERLALDLLDKKVNSLDKKLFTFESKYGIISTTNEWNGSFI